MVSFTGSTRAGRRVAELAAAAPKRTSLELGGKSASVLLDDLSSEELGNAVAGSLTGCLINSGQTCSALTRLVVPRDRLDETPRAVRRGQRRRHVERDGEQGVRVARRAGRTRCVLHNFVVGTTLLDRCRPRNTSS